VELNIKDQKSLLALWNLTTHISNHCLHIAELRMSKPLLALWSLTSKTSNPLHAVWSLASKEWLNPWLHIVELTSIKLK
jgi:hypothetical protein